MNSVYKCKKQAGLVGVEDVMYIYLQTNTDSRENIAGRDRENIINVLNRRWRILLIAGEKAEIRKFSQQDYDNAK